MEKLKLKKVKSYIQQNITDFHQSRINGLRKLDLKKIILKKNPYLYKAKNILTAADYVKNITDAFISSQEETIFGTFLERLAIFVCNEVYGGKKSSSEGIDLEFIKDNVTYLITVKSGTNWGNSSQVAKMKEDFRKAKMRLRTNSLKTNVIAVNGCCYGRVLKPDKGEYLKLAGQEFWFLISGEENLYKKIIEPLGYEAKKRNDEYLIEYSKQLNIFTKQFSLAFCDDGLIDWEKIVQFNSGKEKLKVNL